MRRNTLWFVIAAVVLSILVVPGTTNAENREIWVAIGPAIPTGGSFNDVFGANILGLYIGADFDVTPKLKVGGAIERNGFSADYGAYNAAEVEGGGATLLGIAARGRYFLLPQGTQPYATASLGITHVSFSNVDYSVTTPAYSTQGTLNFEGETKPRFSLGFGVDHPAPFNDKVKFFAEGNFNLVFTDGESIKYVSLRIGARYGI